MKIAISLLKQFFSTALLMFVVPSHPLMSAREIVSRRIAVLKMVIVANYLALALVAVFYGLTWAFSQIFGLAMPESASLIARVSAFVLVALLAAEMLYDSRYCNEDVVIARRKIARWA